MSMCDTSSTIYPEYMCSTEETCKTADIDFQALLSENGHTVVSSPEGASSPGKKMFSQTNCFIPVLVVEST